MIKHRRERRRSAAVQHGEQRLYLTKRSSPGNIEQTVPSYSIRLFSLNLVHLARVSIRTIFSYRSRSSFRYTKLPKLFIYKKKLGKRERENSATKLASRIAARGIAVEIVATLQRDGDAEEEERVDCARLSYNAKNIR